MMVTNPPSISANARAVMPPATLSTAPMLTQYIEQRNPFSARNTSSISITDFIIYYTRCGWVSFVLRRGIEPLLSPLQLCY